MIDAIFRLIKNRKKNKYRIARMSIGSVQSLFVKYLLIKLRKKQFIQTRNKLFNRMVF